MAREWLLRGVDPEELKKEEVEIVETPKSKWDNFWYHYKWTFWGCVFAAVALAVVLGQMLSSVSPDYRVLLMTEYSYMSGDTEQLAQMLAQYGTDLNGDGEVRINVQNCLMGERALRTNNPGPQMVGAHLKAGDVLFFIWDEKTYEVFMDSVGPQLEEGVEFLTDLPEGPNVIRENKLYVWEWELKRENTEPVTLYFGVRNLQGTAGDKQELHDQSMKLLEAFIKNEKTGK